MMMSKEHDPLLNNPRQQAVGLFRPLGFASPNHSEEESSTTMERTLPSLKTEGVDNIIE